MEIVYSTSAKTTIPALDKIFATHGIPESVRSDNGPPFSGYEFKQFATYLGFVHRKVTPEWPEAQGEVERFMRTLKKSIHTAVVERKPWKQQMWKFLRQYRATPHSSTKVSPAEALFSRQIATEIPHFQDKPTDSMTKEVIMRNDQEAKEKMKKYADNRRHTTQQNIQEGDSVILENPHPKKMDPPFNPVPKKVIRKKGDMITASDGKKVVTRNASKFKKLSTNIPVIAESDSDVMSDSDSSDNIDMDTMGPGVPIQGQQDAEVFVRQPPRVRPQRLRRPPRYLEDYVHR